MNHPHHTSRRQFLQTAGSLALAAGFPAAALLGRADSTGHWVVACRDAHLKATNKPCCWSALKEIGAAGVEVSVGYDLACPGLFHPEKKYSLATEDAVKLLIDDLAANSITLTAFCLGNHFDGELEKELDRLKKLVPVAQKLGVKAIRIDVAAHKTPLDQFLPVAINACKQICPLVESTPVHYGIENHSRFTNDPVVLEKIFDGVGSAHLGLTLDALNFYWYGHPLNDLYPMYEKFASRVVHTHCKSIKYPEDQRNVRRPMGWEYGKYTAPIYEGDIDYKRVAAILRKANYQGDLCLENECLGHFPVEQRPDVLKKEIALLKELA